MVQSTEAPVRRLPTLQYSNPCLTSNLIQMSIALDSATVASTNERTFHGPLSSAVVKAELLSFGEQSSALAHNAYDEWSRRAHFRAPGRISRTAP